MNKYLQYYTSMFKVGLFTIGGGLAMLPIISEELPKKGIAKKEDIFEAYSKSQAFPGVIAVNTCVFLGYKVDKFLGALIMTLGVISPSIIIIYLFSLIYSYIQDIAVIDTFFSGMRVAVVSILIVTVFRLVRRIHRSIPTVLLALGSFIAATFTTIPIYFIIIIGGLISIPLFIEEVE